jgi:hypothetical protein
MGLLNGILLVVLGLLAASQSIVARRPDVQKYFDALLPYQGWLGFIACLWGIWMVLYAVLHLDWLRYVPILWATVLLAGAIEFSLGLLLGYPLLTKHLLSRHAEAMKRGEQVQRSLAPHQTTLGYLGILLGVWTIVATFLFSVV